MTVAARLVLLAAAVAGGALTVASLALANVIAPWGVLFFYVVPSLFFVAWTGRELAPARWRRAATPLRRAIRSRLPSAPQYAELPPPPPPRAAPDAPERIRSLSDVLAVLARLWLTMMRAFLELVRSPRMRRIFNVVFGVAAAAILVLVARELANLGWPLKNARAVPSAAAAAFFISTFALRAIAWQRLFRPFERPRTLALVASTGTASVAALALPSRIDDAISVTVLRRIARRPPSVGTLVLSLFLLGLLDMAALTPFSIFAAVEAPTYSVRLSLAVVAFVGVGAGVLTAALPSIRRSDRLVQYRLGHWLALHAPSSPGDAAVAWFFVGASWLTKAAGLYLLLDALGLPLSFSLASSYVAAAAAAAALPIGPAGAATQAGFGVAVLAGAGVDTTAAISLAVGAQALTVAAGAVLAGFATATQLGRRRLGTTETAE